MRFIWPARVALASTLLIAAATLSASGALCPFCSAPTLTLSEQLAQADAAVLAQWVDGTRGDEQHPGNVTYEIVQVLRSPTASIPATPRDSENKAKGSLAGGDTQPPAANGNKELATRVNSPQSVSIHKGDRITLDQYQAGKKGDLFLVMGTLTTVIQWGSPLEVTETSFNYVAQAPSPESPSRDRLTYFLKFMEYPDPLISNDAYAEFANAPYKDIAPLKDVLPRDKLRAWLTSPDTPSSRLGLYGMLLGLCGNADDSKLMEQRITEETDSYRLGIDGIMGGYLLLMGEKGLDLVDESKLRNKKAPFTETYAAMQALRFVWTYGDGHISKERLRASMRILLDRPELADLVIADLARWKDWSIQEQLMKFYGAKEYNVPSIKRAIIRYMLQASKDGAKKDGTDQPAHVLAAQKNLEALRLSDAKTVEEAERYFFFD